MSPKIKTGDLIGFSGWYRESILINLLSYGIPWWSISHVGIIGEYEGESLLFESTTLSNIPCVVNGEFVKGTQAVRLNDRLAKYVGRVWHYPLYRRLFDAEAERLNQFLIDHLGIPYDCIGAFRAGGEAWSLIEGLLFKEDLSHIFCSELCAAAHREIGMLRTDNISRWNPNRLIRTERWRRVLAKPRRLK